MSDNDEPLAQAPGECIVVDGDDSGEIVAMFRSMGLRARSGTITPCVKCGFLVGEKYVNEPECTVCLAIGNHKPGCHYLIAMTCPVAINCEHGIHVCTVCTPCTC